MGEQETWTSLRFPQPCPGTSWPVAAMGHLCSARMSLCDLGQVFPSRAGGPSAGNPGAPPAEVGGAIAEWAGQEAEPAIEGRRSIAL